MLQGFGLLPGVGSYPQFSVGPSYDATTAANNAASLSSAMAAGGRVTLAGVGTAYVSSWPAGVASTEVIIPDGLTISDGGTGTVNGPAVLYAGYWPNGKTTINAVVTNTSATVTSAGAGFTQQDVGKLVNVTNPANGNQVLTGTISLVNSATSITLSDTATASWSSGLLYIGSDNSTALTNALTQVSTNKAGELKLASGIAMVGTGITVPDGICLKGDGRQFTVYNQVATFGAILVAASAGAYPTSWLVKVGVSTTKTGVMGARIDNLLIDGANKAIRAVWLHGACAEIHECRVTRGATYTVLQDGPIQKIFNSGITSQLSGYTLYITGATDAIYYGNYINGAAGTIGAPKANILIDTSTSGDLLFQNNHIWQEAPLSVNTPANNVRIVGTNWAQLGIFFLGNIFDSCYGHHISVSCDQAGGVIENLIISGNWFMQNDVNFPDATFDIINLNTNTNGSIISVVVSDNTSLNLVNANAWNNYVNCVGSGTFLGLQISTSSLIRVNAFVNDLTKIAGIRGCFSIVGAGTNIVSESRGRSTQSGNAATLIFNIAHGLGATPTSWTVVPRVALAAPNFIVTATSTNLVVTYATAPPNVASNVDLTWSACL
jgi:hypothetical protein